MALEPRSWRRAEPCWDDTPGELSRRWCDEIFNHGRVETVDELFAPHCVLYDFGLAEKPIRSASALKQQVETLRSAFPDLHMTLSHMICEGHRVAFLCRVSGTHLGEGLGIPATGRSLEIRGMSMGCWRDGRLVRGWNQFDMLKLYQGLGLLALFDEAEAPPPSAGAPADPASGGTRAEWKAAEPGDDNRTRALRWCDEVYNQGRLETLEELFDPGCVIHDGGLAGHPIENASAFADQAAAMRAAFPDIRLEVEDTVAEGDLVAFRGTFTGTHTGDGMGIAPTGRFLEVRGMSMGRWREGRLVEGWNHYDLLSLYRGLGLLRLFDASDLR